MSNKTVLKKNLKEERAKLNERLSSLKKTIGDFKTERKANWKTFKNAMKDEVIKIEKSIDKLRARKLTKPMKLSLPPNGSAHAKVSVSENG